MSIVSKLRLTASGELGVGLIELSSVDKGVQGREDAAVTKYWLNLLANSFAPSLKQDQFCVGQGRADFRACHKFDSRGLLPISPQK